VTNLDFNFVELQTNERTDYYSAAIHVRGLFYMKVKVKVL